MTHPDPIDNPYDPPAIGLGRELPFLGAGPISIMGRDLVVPSGTTLPPLCVKTGRPMEGRPIVKEFSQAPWWLAIPVMGLSALVSAAALATNGLIVLAILYFFLRRKGTVRFFLDPKIRNRGENAAVICGLSALGGVAAFVALGATERIWLLPLALILLAIAIFLLPLARPIRASRISGSDVWLRGIPHPVMAALVGASGGRPPAAPDPMNQLEWLD